MTRLIIDVPSPNSDILRIALCLVTKLQIGINASASVRKMSEIEFMLLISQICREFNENGCAKVSIFGFFCSYSSIMLHVEALHWDKSWCVRHLCHTPLVIFFFFLICVQFRHWRLSPNKIKKAHYISKKRGGPGGLLPREISENSGNKWLN